MPSRPLAQVFAYDMKTAKWVAYKDKDLATMDHRGLLQYDDRYWTVGGMIEGQLVSDRVTGFKLKF